MAFDLSSALPYLSPALSSEDTAPFHVYGSGDAPIARAFSRSLVVNYVLDEPGALVFVRERDVGESLREDLHLCALDNLRRRATLRAPRFEPKGATHHATWDGQHDAALLLLDELWDHRSAELVAAVPARNKLLFCERRSDEALAELHAQTAKERASLSCEIFGRRDRQWHPL